MEIRTVNVDREPAVIGLSPRNQGFQRYLTIDGMPAVRIGNNCGSCGFFFQRVDGFVRHLSPTLLADRLNHGLVDVADDLVESASSILPAGMFLSSLMAVRLKRTAFGSSDDYFTKERTITWSRGTEFWGGIPYDTLTDYYRCRTVRFEERKALFEFVVPLYPLSELTPERVREYEQSMRIGTAPTALVLSLLDIQAPHASWKYDTATREPDLVEHWCLTHYLIDGNHKSLAAANTGTVLTLLSFLSVSESLATPGDVQRLFKILEQPSTDTDALTH